MISRNSDTKSRNIHIHIRRVENAVCGTPLIPGRSRILEALCIERGNSTPSFATLPERENENIKYSTPTRESRTPQPSRLQSYAYVSEPQRS